MKSTQNAAGFAIVGLVLVPLVCFGQAQPEVYRCPGPPVVYTDQITPQQAAERGCKSVEKAPTRQCGAKDPKTGKVTSPCEPIDADRLISELRAEAPKQSQWKPRELGSIDKWRFESCQADAAKAPTETGVRVGLRLCREKFGQQPPSAQD